MVQPFSLGQLASPDTGSGRRPPTSLRAQRSNSDFRPDGLPRRFRLRSLSFGGQVAPLHKRFAFVAGNAVDRSEYDFTFSRRDAPEVLHFVVPPEIRGRREDRVRAAPAVSRAMVDSGRTRAYRFGGNTPAFPAQWLYGLYEFALVTGFLATIIPEKRLLLDDLTPAPGRQAHTTSPYALASSVRTLLRATPSRPPRPPPTFATTADAPLAGKDGGSYGGDLGQPGSGMFFARRLDRWNRVDVVEEISLSAQWRCRSSDRLCRKAFVRKRSLHRRAGKWPIGIGAPDARHAFQRLRIQVAALTAPTGASPLMILATC
jgi:hypothetical protein